MPDEQHENVEESPAAASSWRISETRPLAPFAQERHVLDDTAFAPFAGGEPDAVTSIYYISDVFEPEDFKPRFHLNVDFKKLKETTHFGVDELLLSLTARGHTTKNYKRIQSWKLNEFPETYECSVEDTHDLSPLHRLTFCVIVSIPNDIPKEFGKPHFQASVLAEKRFLVQKQPESPSFPIKPAPPEFFEQHRLPADTLWLVELGADVQATPEEAVTVYINTLAIRKLNKAFGGNVAGGLLKNQVASEIFFDICQRTLLAPVSEPIEEGSLVEQVLKYFDKFDLTSSQLKEMVEEPGGWRLRCFVQSHLDLTRKIETADLRRPWAR